ncbi:P44 [Goji berry chlorosis virus]|nr:P44 [Goji berry chlorosis virus]
MSSGKDAEFVVHVSGGSVVDIEWGDKILRFDIVRPSGSTMKSGGVTRYISGYCYGLGDDDVRVAGFILDGVRGLDAIPGATSTSWLCVGSPGSVILGLTLRGVNGKLRKIEVKHSKTVAIFDSRGVGPIKEVVENAGKILAQDKVLLDAKGEVVKEIHKRIAELRALGDPSTEYKTKISTLLKLAQDMGVSTTEEKVVDDLTDVFGEYMSKNEHLNEKIQEDFRRWRFAVHMDLADLTADTLRQTNDHTQELLADLRAKISEKDSLSGGNQRRLRQLQLQIKDQYDRIVSGTENQADQQIDALTAYLMPTSADRRYGISGSRTTHVNWLLDQITRDKKILGESEVVEYSYPSELERAVKDLRVRVLEIKTKCDVHKKTLLDQILKISNELN